VHKTGGNDRMVATMTTGY